DLTIQGNPDGNGGISHCSFAATKDSVRLTGRNPVELVGLAAINSRFPDFQHSSDTWRPEGPNLMNQLIKDWEKHWGKLD
ncbi:MAG: hypothetical protein AAF497_22890, partial [Planctomycetota bacterium]